MRGFWLVLLSFLIVHQVHAMESYADLVETIMPSVVNISTERKIINDDENVDIADVVEVLSCMANGEVADVNNDGQTDIADVVAVLAIMAQQ